MLESLARTSTEGVSVEIVDEGTPTCNGLGQVRLPKSLFEPGKERDLILVWNHELQHSRDMLDHVDYISDVLLEGNEDRLDKMNQRMEELAYRAEVRTGLTVDLHWWDDPSG